MRRSILAVVVLLALAGCGGHSAAESRFLASMHGEAAGMSDSTLLQAGHDFCDHRSDPDGGYSCSVSGHLSR